MNVIRAVKEMQEAARGVKRAGRRVALVPTMGALHAGHVALIRKAREQNAAVAVSIYVNPTQFGSQEDFNNYPRDIETDCQTCEREAADVVFAPTDEEMYPDKGAATWVEETKLAKRWEGEKRPGHLRGVCTVVAKLFNIVQPDVAVFGQKDYQQVKVVERMVRDLCYPIEIVSVPIVREDSGLAVSSRNQFLNPQERAQAAVLNKALNVAQEMFNEGEHNAHRIETAMMRTIELAPSARLDYAEIADARTLEPSHDVKRGDVVLVSAYFGKTRLIDNLIL